ncbi:3-oxoacyl-[acyl-carrier protein] reductase [Duganella sacchari]|uniref:3-oxoacyl-[acyl-carrier protein] reductase n=1 Tax=Duganella sacchari TaxID=551987 RepID=A0A1M7N292_9BURK|nr:SDR family oxidoreductase [Duganella sacchari]SHM97673.1 3-oxoacyl-[acyl-carrier protein] reductase [Duganella sacchari]
MNPTGATYAGKLALITGSRRGVGRLVAEHILRNGGRVAGFARGESTIDHPGYHHFQVDIGDPASVQQGFAALKKVSDAVHIVINNAAVLTSQYAMIMPPAQAQAMINTNLMGAFMVSREASKLMRKGKWGRIINIGSMAVSLEPIGDSVYAACKAGLTTLANVMAKELAPLNITCNTLSITAIKTDMLAQLPGDKIDAVIAGLPIPRYAEPDDIFNIIDFLASERSAYITAQTIYMGGVN